ncbi:MAG TPA: Uma2 family endonuclease [Tepidisphaeraceae bacterium]|jgi:Uma2 family endonuclease|nr:Uma2 family endonuclease [Tepidisphaeraceae bacterium]
MTAIAAHTQYTPDDVLRLEDEGLFELVDGKLVEKPMSSLANKTAGIVTIQLGVFLQKSGGGDLLPEQTFQCFPHDRDLIRRPDVAFISAARSAGVPDEGHVPIAPDIAIEVVSPNDTIYELDEKLADYRMAGVKAVWVLNPNSRVLRIHRLDHTFAELQETDTLSDESILPGFSILVRDLLPPRRKPE